MDRCKLEYMIKNFDLENTKKMVREIDPKGIYMFDKNISEFLLNPDTKDLDILIYVGPCSALYCSIALCEDDLSSLEEYKDDMEQEIKECKEKYIAQYKKINELCIQNVTYPFFKDPTNIKECEKTRQDLVAIVPEEILNKFFDVDSMRQYEPLKYSDKKN